MQNTSFEDSDDLLNNASLGVHLVASDGKILWANDLELQLLGDEREECVNRHIGDFHIDNDVIEKILRGPFSGLQRKSYSPQWKPPTCPRPRTVRCIYTTIA